MIKSRIIYGCILVAAFIFSQALYDSIALFTLVCVIVMPLLSGLSLLCCAKTVRVKVSLNKRRINRNQTTSLLMEIRCGAPLLSPEMRLNCILPDPEGTRSVSRRLEVGFSPFSKSELEVPIGFHFRGKYVVGVESVEVFDFLRLFRRKVRLDQTYKFYVTPRFLPTSQRISQNIQLEDGVSSDVVNATAEGTELYGVREMEREDTLRHVHWNLSAAKGEMLIKTFSVNREHQIHMFLDLTDEQPKELQTRRMGDAIVESGLSLCRELTENVGPVSLMWQRGNLQQTLVNSPDTLSVAYERVGLVPMQSEQNLDTTLSGIAGVQALCIVTGRLTEKKRARFEILQQALQCPILLYAFENTAGADVQEMNARNIRLTLFSLDSVEKGRVQ